MKSMILGALATTLALGLTGPVEAKQNCPPGLAKKAVPCIPPGQAKKYGYDDHRYHRIADRYVLRDDWIRVRNRDRDRYRLPRLGENEAYYRDGRIVYRVNEETRRVLELIRLADIVLSN